MSIRDSLIAWWQYGEFESTMRKRREEVERNRLLMDELSAMYTTERIRDLTQALYLIRSMVFKDKKSEILKIIDDVLNIKQAP